jgi:hypothetical protein
VQQKDCRRVFGAGLTVVNFQAIDVDIVEADRTHCELLFLITS